MSTDRRGKRDDDGMKWGARLRAFRRRHNIKQEAAAHLLNVSQSYVSRMENGVLDPSPDIRERLAALVLNPAHRHPLNQLVLIVRRSPHLDALISRRDGLPHIEAASGGFLAAPPFIAQPHPSGGPQPAEQVAPPLRRAIEAGAFDGEIACLELLWRDRSNGETRYYHSVFTPVSGGGEWLLHSATAPLDSDGFARLSRAQDGLEIIHRFAFKGEDDHDS